MADPTQALMRTICEAYAEARAYDSADLCITVATERGEGCVVWLGTIDGGHEIPVGNEPEITAPTLAGALLLLAVRVEKETAERWSKVTNALDALRAEAARVPHG